MIDISDITVRLVDPTSPSIFFLNDSKAILRNYKYWFAIVNPSNVKNGAPRALPIASEISSGDRLTGYIGVSGPNCKQNKLFWIDIKYGVGGWYAEMTENEKHLLEAAIQIPKQFPDGVMVDRHKTIDSR